MNRTDLKAEKYSPSEIEPKWQGKWEEEGIFKPNLDTAKKPFYNLMMFPYPSAEGLHVGNMYAFTGSDIYGRFKRIQGFDVFEPIGLDGFGIHSENYALKVGRHPRQQAKISEKNFYRQLRATGNGFDWSRTVETYSPDYYKWTQWIFIQFFKAGLAYRKKAPVNFCPSCKTVLADEQVIDARPPAASPNQVNTEQAGAAGEVGRGKCERCSSIVEKRDLEQWFFKITHYADRLLEGLSRIDWTEKVKIAQRQWIGRSEGAIIQFSIFNSQFSIPVFTTRPDTLFGATFLVLSPEHPIVASLLSSKLPPEARLAKGGKAQSSKLKEIKDYVEKAKKKTEQERIAEGKEKTGIFTGLHAINPANREEMPILIADYVLMGYGTGAIMGVPAHDQRDYEFAKKYDLPVVEVIKPEKEVKNAKAYVGPGTIINSRDWNGWRVPEEISKAIAWLKEKGMGERQVHYHLRDWLISRQRYWGPPIPMVYCPKCGWVPEKEENLPVLLPDVKDWRPKGTGVSPLAKVAGFVSTTCPTCGGKARRETDVSDTFLDSAWYFFRYISIDFDDRPFDKERVKKWLPVNMYIGGAEHSVLHLLYTRFLTMAFKDLGFVDFEEPFKKFYAHGLLISEGAKMSKSRGNVVIPDEYIKKYGVDSMRCYLMFLGPFNQGGDFRDTGIEGMNRFLKRVWRLVLEYQISNIKYQISNKSKRTMHRTIKRVTEDIESLRYNTAIAGLMEYYNFLSKQKEISQEEITVFLKLLSPFAPHIAEELYQQFFGNSIRQIGGRNSKFNSIHLAPWPAYDPKLLEEEEVTIVVQVNGKVRDSIKIKNEKLKMKNEIEEIAREKEKIKKHLEGKTVKKVIYVEGKVINFVVND